MIEKEKYEAETKCQIGKKKIEKKRTAKVYKRRQENASILYNISRNV